MFTILYITLSSVVHFIVYHPEGLKSKSTVKKNSMHKLPSLNASQSSDEIEILKLELLKKDIEIERLKKGYIVKGVGSNKEFISIRDVNSKSSKN